MKEGNHKENFYELLKKVHGYDDDDGDESEKMRLDKEFLTKVLKIRINKNGGVNIQHVIKKLINSLNEEAMYKLLDNTFKRGGNEKHDAQRKLSMDHFKQISTQMIAEYKLFDYDKYNEGRGDISKNIESESDNESDGESAKKSYDKNSMTVENAIIGTKPNTQVNEVNEDDLSGEDEESDENDEMQESKHKTREQKRKILRERKEKRNEKKIEEIINNIQTIFKEWEELVSEQ